MRIMTIEEKNQQAKQQVNDGCGDYDTVDAGRNGGDYDDVSDDSDDDDINVTGDNEEW